LLQSFIVSVNSYFTSEFKDVQDNRTRCVNEIMGKIWKDNALNISVGTDTAFGDVAIDEL
jgi:hypothetical protein